MDSGWIKMDSFNMTIRIPGEGKQLLPAAPNGAKIPVRYPVEPDLP